MLYFGSTPAKEFFHAHPSLPEPADGQPITVDWTDIDQSTIPSYITDGDDNTQLSEAQVEGFVTNGAINLASGSTVDGSLIVSDRDFTSYLPADLADGDDDSLASTVCVVSGRNFGCGLLSSGEVECSGGGNVTTSIPNVTITDIEATYQSVCGLLNSGSVLCWGDDGSGETYPP